MEKIDLFTLISLIVAVVVVLKLRSVLGRRTGDEEARLERYRAERRQQGATGSASDNVVAMPRREREGAPAAIGAETTVAPRSASRAIPASTPTCAAACSTSRRPTLPSIPTRSCAAPAKLTR
jgi:predicted lipid-binding transport protein (Tim44 family)